MCVLAGGEAGAVDVVAAARGTCVEAANEAVSAVLLLLWASVRPSHTKGRIR